MTVKVDIGLDLGEVVQIPVDQIYELRPRQCLDPAHSASFKDPSATSDD